MARIIFHLGPGKCGSSAIQAFLEAASRGADPLLDAIFVRAPEIQALEAGDTSPLGPLAARMGAARADRPLIVSHEALFKKTGALRALVRAAVGQGGETSALAYVRRQSDYLRSVHGQWLFREPDRVAETAGILRAEGIDPALFTGVERQLMAFALGHVSVGRDAGGFSSFDWSVSMVQRARELDELGVPLHVAALPPRDADRPLLADFAARIGVRKSDATEAAAVVNPAFAPATIEAVTNGIECGFPMPGRHEANRFLAVGDPVVQSIPLPDGALLGWLSDCIDATFEARNRQFAERFGIDPAYFSPRRPCDPSEIGQRIAREAALRSEEPAESRQARITARAGAMRAAWQAFREVDRP
ncbi:hypothetical protein BOO69_07935 [Sulfitobacter alexandrii]|uniref:Uncharacterized protein n=1 Tax=Sulfitobacter alexandrii TaxID=1917485 RepID=A0A1J0WGB9_9RHOB|nr:hypothetical protein [Sulfitobacter alexandrii]APE43354.1 hypothetical protein BOO69_07935 [Sulfitobacter alexandrii]